MVHWRNVVIKTLRDHEAWATSGWTAFFELGSAESQRGIQHLTEALDNLPYIMRKHSLGRCVLARHKGRGNEEGDEVGVGFQDEADEDSEDEIFSV